MISLLRRIIQKLSRDYGWAPLIKKNFEPDENYFSEVYRKKLFGKSESASGPGSGQGAPAAIRSHFSKLLQDFSINSMADIPCGDLFWISKVDLENVSYSGFDIVPSLIATLKSQYPQYNFGQFDAINQIPPKKDLILCRDLLVHLTTQQALQVIENFKKSGSTYLAITTFTTVETNKELVIPKIGVGWRPLNLELVPFDLGLPLRVINEESTEGLRKYKDKSLALFRLN